MQNWVMKQILWLRNKTNAGGVLPTNEWLWREMLCTFGHAFIDTITEACTQLELSKLKMSERDVDGFIAKFE